MVDLISIKRFLHVHIVKGVPLLELVVRNSKPPDYYEIRRNGNFKGNRTSFASFRTYIQVGYYSGLRRFFADLDPIH